MGETWLTSEQQRAWRAFVRLHGELTGRLNRQLQADSGLSLADYEVLVRLSEAPDGRMRPFDLARNLVWEQSRLAHQATRMQRRGLVRREDCAEDGRGTIMVLTATGRTAIETAAPAHVANVRKLFFDGLTAAQVRELDRIGNQALGRLATIE